MMKTADPELMRAINRYHVIDVIRRHGPIARVEIVEHTELSRATISAITGALIEEGIITVQHVAADAASRGRPRVMLALNGSAYHVVGVKLSLQRISIAVTDFRGDLLRDLAIPVRLGRQPPAVSADLVEDGVRQCVADAGLAMSDISAAGIGLPGEIDGVAGISRESPVLGGRPVPFAADMQRRLNLPVLIENDANLIALAEHWDGHARNLASFIVVTLGDTISMALFVDGKLYRGAQSMGADLGHCRMASGSAPTLNKMASQEGIAAAARAAGLVCDADTRPAGAIVAALAARENESAALFHAAGEALGLMLANVLTMLNPPLVILSGEGLGAGGRLADALLAALDRYAPPALRAATRVVLQPWREEVWARGAATLVLRRIYEAPLTLPIG